MEKDRFSRKEFLAKRVLNKSVTKICEMAVLERSKKSEQFLTFGVKDTAGIDKHLVQILSAHEDFLFFTLDKMSDLGRSVDIDLINPLTYRLMTGSSSGSCVNILKGINDFALGTDGGGSVLAPALSTNLYSFLGKGVGFETRIESKSTDDMTFTPGTGIIAKDYVTLKQVICVLLPELVGEYFGQREKKQVFYPKRGTFLLPNGTDATDRIELLIPQFSSIYEFVAVDFSGIYERTIGIQKLEEFFSQGADIVLNFEGPIDVFSYDETIPKAFALGSIPEIAGVPSKGLVKAVNICKKNAFTIPSDTIAAGFVVVIDEPVESVRNALPFVEMLSALVKTPGIFQRFFVRHEKFSTPFEI